MRKPMLEQQHKSRASGLSTIGNVDADVRGDAAS